MVPKVPLGYWLIAGQHVSVSLPCSQLTYATRLCILHNSAHEARAGGRVCMGSRTHVTPNGAQGAPRVLTHSWAAYGRFSNTLTVSQVPPVHLLNLQMPANSPKTRFREKTKAYGAKLGKPRGVLVGTNMLGCSPVGLGPHRAHTIC